MRIYKNQPEQNFSALAASKGWKATKRGWPDFLCRNADGDIIAVEVKPKNARGFLQGLKTEQVEAMRDLQKFGIRCYVSDGIILELFNEKLHASLEAKKRLRISLVD